MRRWRFRYPTALHPVGVVGVFPIYRHCPRIYQKQEGPRVLANRRFKATRVSERGHYTKAEVANRRDKLIWAMTTLPSRLHVPAPWRGPRS